MLGSNLGVLVTTTDANRPATSLGARQLLHLEIVKKDRGFESEKSKPPMSSPTIKTNKANTYNIIIPLYSGHGDETLPHLIYIRQHKFYSTTR